MRSKNKQQENMKTEVNITINKWVEQQSQNNINRKIIEIIVRFFISFY